MWAVPSHRLGSWDEQKRGESKLRTFCLTTLPVCEHECSAASTSCHHGVCCPPQTTRPDKLFLPSVRYFSTTGRKVTSVPL